MDSLNNILEYGTATPYLAIFSQEGTPVPHPVTGVPLGAYISNFTYKYDEEKENQASLTFDTEFPEIVDLPELQEGRTILLQWGYIYTDGSSYSSDIKAIKVKDLNCKFDNVGVHVTIQCVDGVVYLRHLPGHIPNDEEDEDDGYSSMVDYLNRGCDHGVGVIIENFNK